MGDRDNPSRRERSRRYEGRNGGSQRHRRSDRIWDDHDAEDIHHAFPSDAEATEETGEGLPVRVRDPLVEEALRMGEEVPDATAEGVDVADERVGDTHEGEEMTTDLVPDPAATMQKIREQKPEVLDTIPHLATLPPWELFAFARTIGVDVTGVPLVASPTPSDPTPPSDEGGSLLDSVRELPGEARELLEGASHAVIERVRGTPCEDETADVPLTGTEEPSREEPAGTTTDEATRSEPPAKAPKAEKRTKSSGRRTITMAKILPGYTKSDLRRAVVKLGLADHRPDLLDDKTSRDSLAGAVDDILRRRGQRIEDVLSGTVSSPPAATPTAEPPAVSPPPTPSPPATSPNEMVEKMKEKAVRSLVPMKLRSKVKAEILHAASSQGKTLTVQQVDQLANGIVTDEMVNDVTEQAVMLVQGGADTTQAVDSAVEEALRPFQANITSLVEEATPAPPDSPAAATPPPSESLAAKFVRWGTTRHDIRKKSS